MRKSLIISTLAAAFAISACAPMSITTKSLDMKLQYPEVLSVLTQDSTLLTVQASRPNLILEQKNITGLRSGERVVGMDYRPKDNKLYALSNTAQLYEVDAVAGKFQPVGANFHIKLVGSNFGVNFDPDSDRLRVVSDQGQNLLFNPETGVLASTANTTRYSENDIQEDRASSVTALAHTFNKVNDRMTTAYVVDKRLGMLARLGSEAGQEPALSPNTGWLSTIGPLGTGPTEQVFLDVSLDTSNAFMASQGGRLYRVDLKQGRAYPIGELAVGTVAGFAIKPYAAIENQAAKP